VGADEPQKLPIEQIFACLKRLTLFLGNPAAAPAIRALSDAQEIPLGSSRVVGAIRDAGEKRTGAAEPRWQWVTAQLRTAIASYRVRICDLSPLGARVAAERLPDPGMIVCLQRGASAMFGTMAWTQDGEGSILFDEELDVQLFGGAEAGESDDCETLAQAKARLDRVSRR
jgi:hypothetical protein